MFTNRFSKIVVAIVVVAVALVTASLIPAGSISLSVVESEKQGLREYQLGERYGEIPQNVAQFSAEQIRREYILGERYGVTLQEHTYEPALREYWLSERYGQTPIVSVTSVNGLEQYRHSERTLIDPQAGMAAYLNSERTSVPVNFTKYQRSEWFGE